MKNFLNTLWDLLKEMRKAQAAASLARKGQHEQAKKLCVR